MKPTNTEQIVTLVEEFHKAFFVRDTQFADVTARTAFLRRDLISEEFTEYTIAHDRVEYVDALADLAYVTAGSLLQLGLDVLPYSTDRPVPKQRNDWPLITPEVARVTTELNKSKLCKEGLYLALNRLLCRLDDVARVQGFELLDAVQEVHRSNMTKRWTVEPHKDQYPNVDHYRECEDGKYVAYGANGKVIKSPDYSPAKLERF